MPLPEGGNHAWPPKDLDPILAQIDVWAAWYSSDLDRLSQIYGGTVAGNPARPQGWFDPNRGGIRARIGGTLARWFWGTTTPPAERRTKLHLPVARDIAVTSSSLLMGEGPAFKVGDGKDKTAQDRLDKLTGNVLRRTLTEGAELGSGLGGTYYRIVWDTETRDHPWLASVHPDSAVPEWRWDVLSAVTIWREIERDGQTVVRHLERHEPGQILHGVYVGNGTQLGRKAALTEYAETAHLAETVPTGTKRLTACYVPHLRPAPGWRHVPAAANLGRAAFDGAEGLMDALDETWSSWMRDLRLGKGRLLVPDSYLTNLGPGNGAAFDNERELYTGFKTLGAGLDQGLDIVPSQFEIRVAEHRDTCIELLKQIYSMSGHSPSTHGLDGDGAAATATEVRDRQRKSYMTRGKQIDYTVPEIAALLETMLHIDAQVFGTGVTPGEIDIDFGDGVAESPRIMAETLDLLARAEAASIQTRVQMLHPEWDEERVLKEVDGIRKDGGSVDPAADFAAGIRDGSEPFGGDPEEPANEQ